jgi:hypothetical protein
LLPFVADITAYLPVARLWAVITSPGTAAVALAVSSKEMTGNVLSADNMGLSFGRPIAPDGQNRGLSVSNVARAPGT